MNALDVVKLPGTEFWARRLVVDAWIAAGSPPVNSAGRLHGEQLQFWHDYLYNGGAGADNPDDPNQDLGHVRFVALDITPTPARVRALEAAGLIRPYPWEPWHWAVPNVKQYDLVTELPKEWSDMATKQEIKDAMFEVLTGTNLGPGGRNHYDSLKFIADLAASGTAERVWNHDLTAQDEAGKPIVKDGKPVKFKAWGYITSIASYVNKLRARQ